MKLKKEILRLDGLFYQSLFIKKQERVEVIDWLKTLKPIWEMRYSKSNPPPEGDEQRQLKRPVYWLGNWQFACLDYYHPPKGILNRCVSAEDYPPILKKIIANIELVARSTIKKNDIPKGWKLNTCLINFYGSTIDPDSGKKTDIARVGDHKDFEPGPIASVSFGERAFFQFVHGKKDLKNNVIFEQWVGDCSLVLFSGELYKDRAFHRVQRVDNKLKTTFELNIDNFETRRINFSFRYVPEEHIAPFKNFPENLKEDVLPYMQELAQHSAFFKKQL
jgi:hypothetical protein